MNLYEITDDYRKAFDELSAIEGIDKQVIEDSLSHLMEDFNAKAVNVAAYMQNIEADIKAMKEAESRMATRRKVLENQHKNLKAYLIDNMRMADQKKISDPRFSITLRDPSKVVSITDENSIDGKYKSVKTVESINKKALADDLKAGKKVSGARLEDGNYSLLIK